MNVRGVQNQTNLMEKLQTKPTKTEIAKNHIWNGLDVL